MHHPDAGHPGQQFAGEVLGGADADRTVSDRLRLLLRLGDQVGEAAEAMVGLYRDHQRKEDHRRDHLEVVDRLERQRAVQCAGGRVAASQHDQRRAIGCRLGDMVGCNGAAGARATLDDHRFAKPLRQAIGDDARNDVGVAAGGEAVHQRDWPVRIAVLRGCGGDQRESNNDAQNGRAKPHVILPRKRAAAWVRGHHRSPASTGKARWRKSLASRASVRWSRKIFNSRIFVDVYIGTRY